MHFVSRSVTVAAFVGLLSARCLAGEPDLHSLPEPVQKTARAQIGQANIDEIEDTFEDGQRAYEVEFQRHGEKLAVVIATDGRLIQLEHRLSVANATKELKEGIEKNFPGGTLSHLKRIEKDGKSFFEASIKHAGKTLQAMFDASGKLLSQRK